MWQFILFRVYLVYNFSLVTQKQSDVFSQMFKFKKGFLYSFTAYVNGNCVEQHWLSVHSVFHAWCRQSDLPINSMPSASEVGPENGAKPKRKRKERFREEKPLKADNANCSNILKEYKDPKDEARVDNMGQDMCMKNGEEWEAANDKLVIL